MKIGVVTNLLKEAAKPTLERLVKEAKKIEASVMACDDSTKLMPEIEYVEQSEMLNQLDILVALGGDGTILRATRLLNGKDIPILGVNLGSLGFLTSIRIENLEHALQSINAGDYKISSRSMISCQLLKDNKQIGEYQALNDIAIGWGESTRVVNMTVAIQGEEVASYICDGLVISTPTGSTGHSMSAGGPIVHPLVSAIVICPICPHTLSNRPLVVSDNQNITISIEENPKELLFAIDGQIQNTISTNQRVELSKSPNVTRLIHLPEYSYFEILQHKLNWHGSIIKAPK